MSDFESDFALDAFKDFVSAKINSLTSDDGVVITATKDLLAAVDGNPQKLFLVFCAAYDKLLNTEGWASTAVYFFGILVPHVAPWTAYPNLLMTCPQLNIYLMLVTMDTKIKQSIQSADWNTAVLSFKAELLRRGLTYATEEMADTQQLFSMHHLGKFIDLVVSVGPQVDQNEEEKKELTEILAKLQQRGTAAPPWAQLAVSGLLRLRANGWDMASLHSA